MFTSRLPKSTSARRPSNPNDGSTSLFGTSIPVSVRKANLFTPQMKRSLGGLNSTSRKSYMTTDKKYQRPSNPDRDEQHRMFENLVEYLQTHDPNFPVPEARRFFSSVSTTECSRIFEFLISKILPDFKINKLEFDVPKVLTSLEYPYMKSVTRSSLVSITTSQSIINLLVIFDWLVKELSDMEIDDSAPIEDLASNGDGVDADMYFKVSCLVTNPPDAKAESDRRCDERDAASKPRLEDVEKLIADRDRLAREWDDIHSNNDDLQAFAKDNAECDRYKVQITEYLAKLYSEETAKDQKSKKNEREICELRKELDENSPILDIEQDTCDQETVESLKERHLKVERELNNMRLIKEDSPEIALKKEEFARIEAKYTEAKDSLLQIKSSELNKLNVAKNQTSEIQQVNAKKLREISGIIVGEAQSILKRSEADSEKWAQVVRKQEEDSKVARLVGMKLRAKLKLKR